jgi:hypothetical protein
MNYSKVKNQLDNELIMCLFYFNHNNNSYVSREYFVLRDVR